MASLHSSHLNVGQQRHEKKKGKNASNAWKCYRKACYTAYVLDDIKYLL